MVARICCLLLIWTATACVVTDEIEFYDKINMPPQLHSIQPPNNNIDTITNNSKITYTVTLWDPDAEDASLYSGEVKVIEQRNTGPLELLSQPCKLLGGSVPDPGEYEGGVLVTLKCDATFQLKNAPEQTTLLVEVTISDRQSSVSDDKEAKGLTVIWALELYPENGN